jgi:predicted nuclease with TOPRIM domain|tara:strand:+ start:326 stop:610 length:285 start_codon:yes stop_codon:yes gene_type:complete
MAKKSKEIKFTQDELTNIESIRNGFNEVQTLLGRLEIQRIQTEQALENIHNDKLRLETRYSDLVDEERKVVSDLQEKYGPGNLDPDTGVFTPIK